MSSLDQFYKFSRRKPHEENISSSRGGFNLQLKPYKSITTGERQRVYASVHYASASKLSGYTSYITREGASADGKKPELFTEEGKNVNTEQIHNEERFFKIIISPDNKVSDLKEYTSDVMKQASKVTGKKLEWYAAEHTNTEKPHVHIVIRGIADKQDLKLDPRFIKQGLREIAQDRATMELGNRTKKEIALQKENELKADRYTAIDRDIAKNCKQEDGRTLIRAKTDEQNNRLNNLVEKGIAVKEAAFTYQLSNTWDKKLQYMGYREDIIKRMSGAIKEGNPEQYFHLTKNMTVQGTVVHKDFENEQTDKSFAVIKVDSGKTEKFFYYTGKGVPGASIGDEVSIQKGAFKNLTRSDVSLEKASLSKEQVLTQKTNQSKIELSTTDKKQLLKNASASDTHKTKYYYVPHISQSVTGTVVKTGIENTKEKTAYAIIAKFDDISKISTYFYYSGKDFNTLDKGDNVSIKNGMVKNLTRSQSKSIEL